MYQGTKRQQKMKTIKNVMLQHVPIKLELHEEQEAETLQRQYPEQKEHGKSESKVELRVQPDEPYTDETDESEADDDEDDAIDEDEATLLISSEEEAELEAQRIRFHELLAKSLLRESGGRNNNTSCSASNIESGTSTNITPNSSRSTSIVRGARLRSRRCSTTSTEIISDKPINKTRKPNLSQKKKRISRKKQRQLKQQKVQQKLKIQRQQLQRLQQEQELWRKEQAQQKQQIEQDKLENTTLSETKKQRDKRGSSICSVSSSLSSTTSQSEGCGCILIYDGQNKLIFNCGLCDQRYDTLNSYAKHLCISHKLIDEENIGSAEVGIDIKKEVLTEDLALPAVSAGINQELCGNIFILQRKKLFISCDFCECRYANLDLFQKHLRQHHKLLLSIPNSEKRMQFGEQQEQPIINKGIDVATKKEIKTEIFIITELPTNSGINAPAEVPISATITSLRTSPCCELTSSVDQPMVSIPQINNVIINQVKTNENGTTDDTNNQTHSQHDLSALNETMLEKIPYADKTLPITGEHIDNSISINSKKTTEVSETEALPDVSNQTQDQTLEELKQNHPSRKRKKKEKEVPIEKKKCIADVIDTITDENKGLQKKKRGRPKRETETSKIKTITSNKKITFENRDMHPRSKRQRNKTTSTKTSSVIDEEKPSQAHSLSSELPRNVSMDGITDEKESINELQQSVADLFKKLTESPKSNKPWAISKESTGIMKNHGYAQLNESIEIIATQQTQMTDKELSEKTAEHKKKLTLSFSPSTQTPSDSQPTTPNGSLIEAKDNSLNSNRVSKSSKNQYQCQFCSKSFAKLSRCVEHTRIHTGEKPFRCDICSREFRLKMRLNEHKLRHREERAFKCEICSLALATKQDLQQHLRHHNGDRRFQCSQCPKAFVRGSDLKIHKRVHTGEKPYTCEICNKKFRANQNLTVHRRSHTLEKNFPCEICNKRFMRKVDRKVHMRTHTGEKPYKCEICQRGYSSRVHVRAHLEREHVLGFCGLKQERKGKKNLRDSLVKEKQNIAVHQKGSNHSSVDGTDHEVKAEEPEQKQYEQEGQKREILGNDKVLSCTVNDNMVMTKSRRQTKTEKQALPATISTTLPTPARRVGPRKLALPTDLTSPLLHSPSLTTDTTALATEQRVSSPSIQKSQHVSVTVSMQVESVGHTDDEIRNDCDTTDGAMPEKENDNSILTVAGVTVPSVSVNNGNSPLKVHVKNERSKITSYFTVVGQKSEI